MDPDSLLGYTYLILSILGAGFCLVLSWSAGSLCSNDTEKEQRLSLGFSTRICGVVSCFLISLVIAIYSIIQIVPNVIGPLILLALFLVYTVLLVLAFAIGGVHGKDDEHNFAFFRPFGVLFSALSSIVFKAANLRVHEDVTEEDFLNLVDDVAEDEVIDEHQKEMITNIVELNDVSAGEIMTHRTELISVSTTAKASEIIPLITKNGVSRLPVYAKNIDEIAGILYAKDLLMLWGEENAEDLEVSKLMRTDIIFVPEARPASELLVDFRTKRTQIAIVVDEYGGTSGVVTMEDILEEIVGNIQDEFDNETEEMQIIDSDNILASGSADLEDLFDAFDMSMPETEADSIGGLVADTLGRIPVLEENAKIIFGDILFSVKEVGERHIESVLCTKQYPSEESGDSDDQ